MVDNKEQYGFRGNKILGITVHNTGNDLSAKDNYEFMQNGTDSRGCHFLVDEHENIQAMPLNWSVYHTGMAIDWACKHTIAIEICRSQSDQSTYLLVEQNAVKLIKQLMERYNLSTDDIYFHIDFRNRTYCPHKILEMYGSKQKWIERWFK